MNIKRFFAIAVLILIGFFSVKASIVSAASVTPASGGGAISADTAGGAYTDLTSLVITESTVADIGTGTIILNAPSGFHFDTGTVVTATSTATGSCATNTIVKLGSVTSTSQEATPTLTTITITVAAQSTGVAGCASRITYSNVRARPINGTPLASGSITNSGTAPNVPGGSSNFGTLTEVPGALANFTFATIGAQTAGTAFNITMTAKDQFGNTVTSFTGTTNLSTTAGTISPTQSGAFSSGARTESVSVTQSGSSKIITATRTGGSEAGTSNTFTVSAGALANFTFATIGAQTAGTAFNITMTAKDQFGNTVTSFTGTTNLSTTAGTISPTQSGAFSSGARTESVSVTQSGSSKIITATRTGGSEAGTSNTFTVSAGAKNKVTITTQPSSTATAGSDFATKPAVAIQDQFGNTVTTDASTITREAVLSTQSCGGTPTSGTLSSAPGSSASATAGVLSYTAMQHNVNESIKICFSSAGITSALSDTVVVSAGTLTSNISPAYPNHYAWNDSIGWIDFFKTNNTGNSVIIDTTKIKGSAVLCNSDANCNTSDYLSLDCATSPYSPADYCSTINYGVTKTGNDLAGYAWNDGIGWVSFNCSNTGSCGTVDYKVSILQSGDFTGYAWADSVGWISFNCANTSSCDSGVNPVEYRVRKTAPSPTSGHLTSQTFDVCGGTSCSGAAYNYILWKGDLKGGENTVKFHFATSDCENGATNAPTCDQNVGWGGSKVSGDGAFLGPGGTAADTDKYGNPLGDNIPIPISGIYHKNKRYYRYKVYLFRGGAESPVVEDVIINWSR